MCSAKRFAFPVMDALNTAKTHMTEIDPCSLPRIREALQRRGVCPASTTDEGRGITCSLRVGDYVALPITIVGTAAGRSFTIESGEQDCNILLHAPGLAGAFPVRLSELVAFRGHIDTSVGGRTRAVDDDDADDAASVQLGSLCLLETLDKRGIAGGVLESFYTRARRNNCACVGSAQLLARGDEINVEGLSLDFPYHCGGAQASKRFMDITDAACTHFASHCTHGTKVLSRYGVAVAVGVAIDHTMQVPCLFWHPSGAPAACLAPVLHGSRLIPVGETKLAYNGPIASCEMLHTEDPQRYMNPTILGKYDCTMWLTEGLFGVHPGEPWPGVSRSKDDNGEWRVLGVAYDKAEAEFELFVRNNHTGVIAPADELQRKQTFSQTPRQ